MGRRKKQDQQLDNDLSVVVSPSRKDVKAIEIRAAALTDTFFCNYSYDHTVAPETVNSVAIKSKVPIHEDLRAAFEKLHVGCDLR